MRLLGVELARLRSRPAVIVMLLVTAAFVGLVAFATVYDTRPVSATEQATAEQLLERQQASSQEEYAQCLEDPEPFFGPERSTADCESLLPTIDWFLTRAQLDLAREVHDGGTSVMVMLAGLAILVAATFAGADWASGSMSTQLLFQPRRLRAWITKAAAVVLGCTGAAAVLLALFWGSLAAVASRRGLDVPDEAWTSILATSLRSLALVAGVALGSFALTMLFRRTVATLGLLFAYAVVGEGLAASLPIDKMSQWSMANNVMAWLHDGHEVYDESICSGAVDACDRLYTLTLTHSAVYLGVLLVLAVALSIVFFRRRDVP